MIVVLIEELDEEKENYCKLKVEFKKIIIK